MKKTVLIFSTLLLLIQSLATNADPRLPEVEAEGRYIKWGSMIYWPDGTQCFLVLGNIECADEGYFRESDVHQLAQKRTIKHISNGIIAADNGAVCIRFKDHALCRKLIKT